MISTRQIKYILVAIMIVCAIILVICTIMEKKLQKKLCNNYINSIRNYINEGSSLLDAWKQILALFPEKSFEYRKIKEASEFMETALIPDYHKAINIIETAFSRKEVKMMHKDILEGKSINTGGNE